MTRADIVRTAFAALGKAPRLVHVPAGFMKAYAVALRPLHPRLGDFIAFAIRVSTNEAVAPAVGTRTLREYFDALASSSVS